MKQAEEEEEEGGGAVGMGKAARGVEEAAWRWDNVICARRAAEAEEEVVVEGEGESILPAQRREKEE